MVFLAGAIAADSPIWHQRHHHTLIRFIVAHPSDKVTTLSEDGESDWVRLDRAKNRLLISSVAWYTSKVTVEYSDDGVTVYGLSELSWGTMPISRNYVLDIPGLGGFARITCIDYGGSPNTLKVIDPHSNRP